MVWSSKQVRKAKCDARECLITNNSPNTLMISCDGPRCPRWTHYICAKPKPLKKHQNKFFCEFCTGPPNVNARRNAAAAEAEERRKKNQLMSDESSGLSDSDDEH